MAVGRDETTFEDLDGTPDLEGEQPGATPAEGKTNGAAAADETDDFSDLSSSFPDIEADPIAGVALEDDAAGKKGEAAAPNAEEEADPDDDSKLSEDMKRRILRARRVAEFDKEQEVIAERVEKERLQQEVETLRRQQAAAPAPQTGQEHPVLTQAKAKLAETRKKLREAKVDGDVDAEIEAESEMRKAEIVLWNVEARIQQMQQTPPARHPAQGEGARPQDPARQPAAQPPQIHPDVSGWLDRNKSWYGQPGHEAATAKAKEIDADLFKRGYRVGDPDYFKELDRRLSKEGVVKPGAAAPTGGSHVAPAGAGGSSGGGTPNAGGSRNRLRLSADEVSNMRRFKLDPRNPQHVQEYLRNARRAAA